MRRDDRRRHRGQALVEFSLLLPFLVTFTFGAIAIQTYIDALNELQGAVTHAAQAGGRDATDPCTSGSPSGSGVTDMQTAFNETLNAQQQQGASSFTTVPTLHITCPSTGVGPMGVSATGTIKLEWLPIFNQLTLTANGSGYIENFRNRA